MIVADLVPASLDDDPLRIDPASAGALADAYAFAGDVLQQLVDDAGPDDAPSAVTLWPEHFDIAIELGPGDARANYGLSPGDEGHPEPYLYVGPWTAAVEGELWNGTGGFEGAELTWSDLVAADDPRAAALEFFKTRMDALRRTA